MTPEQLKQLYLEPDHVLTPSDYENALYTQGACNAAGLWKSANQALEKILEEANARKQGTIFWNSHPILRLYLEQLVSLSGNDITDNESGGGWIHDSVYCGMSYNTATRICKAKIAEGKVDAT